MLKRLRWKITWLITGMTVLLLAAVFAVLCSSTALSYRNRSIEAMQNALRQASEHPAPEHSTAVPPSPESDMDTLKSGSRPAQPSDSVSPPPPRQEMDAVAVLEISDASNTPTVLTNHIFSLSDEDAITFALLAEKEGKDCGALRGQHLRYMRQKTPQNTMRYALADTFGEDRALRTQMIHSSVIALLAMLAFFAASYLLSRRLVAPVETAWKQQQQFVSDASHELKTPLTVILSNTSLLLRDHPGQEDPSAERTRRIQNEAVRMKQLVESLLLLARSDSGRLSQDYSQIDFSFLADSSVMAFEPVAFENGREIQADIAQNIQIYGNETRLRQLADILLDNACKYSSPSSVIDVRLSERKEKNLISFSVSSEGKPLSPEEQKQIFLRFYRADPSRGEIPGFGLGLAIASSIVSEHHGTIQVSSDGIKTNTFTVLLPETAGNPRKIS